jgi:hypothetical protein
MTVWWGDALQCCPQQSDGAAIDKQLDDETRF